MAFNAKNLHYEKNEPAFLRRIRGEYSSDRHNVQIARPKKDRLKTADDDDAPTIVNESGETVSVDEYEKMVSKATAVTVADQSSSANGTKVEDHEVVEKEEQRREPEKQKVSEIGGPKKRKAVKVVGDDVEHMELMDESWKLNRDEKKATNLKQGSKKKVKKVKLSFDGLET